MSEEQGQVAKVPGRQTGEESETLGALAAALAKAQGAMRPAKKDALNPHFKSKYADLASIWEVAREPLAANGLAVMQRVTNTDTAAIITTHMIHSSGEWVKDRCYWPVAQRTPQGIGSAITYGKRYALAALLGIAAEEDDDGNAASAHPAPESGARSAQRNASAKVGRAEAKTSQLPVGAPTESQRHAVGAITSGDMSKVSPPPVDVGPKVPPTPDPEAARNAARAGRIWKGAKAQGYTRETFEPFVAGELGTLKQSVDWTHEDMDRLEFALAQVNGAAQSQ